MRCVANRLAVVLGFAIVGVAAAPVLSLGQGGQSPLMPPQSDAFGKSFQEWNELYSQWVNESLYGGGIEGSGTVGRVRFLPGGTDPNAVIYITLPPGTPF